MRQSLAKGTRRELRRALGPTALDALQGFDQSIAILQAGLSATQHQVADLAISHAALRSSMVKTFDLWNDPPASDTPVITRRLWDRHVALDDRLHAFETRPFLGRLRWLFTGA